MVSFSVVTTARAYIPRCDQSHRMLMFRAAMKSEAWTFVAGLRCSAPPCPKSSHRRTDRWPPRWRCRVQVNRGGHAETLVLKKLWAKLHGQPLGRGRHIGAAAGCHKAHRRWCAAGSAGKTSFSTEKQGCFVRLSLFVTLIHLPVFGPHIARRHHSVDGRGGDKASIQGDGVDIVESGQVRQRGRCAAR